MDSTTVSRADLFKEDSPSPEPDQELEELLKSKLANVYGLPVDIPTASEEPANNDEADEAEEFEFRLFSRPSAKVLIQDEEPLGEGSFTAHRDINYYVAQPATGLKKSQFEFAAVSGEQVLQQLQIRYPGLEKPWKVTVIKAPLARSKKSAPTSDGKTRPNKKRRILLRQRKRAADEKAAKEAAQVAEKEEALKEKKKRKNRAQQLKRREKKRATKAGGEAGHEAGEEAGETSD